MPFPAQQLAHSAHFTLPQDLTIALVTGITDVNINNVLDIAVGAAGGAKLVAQTGSGTTDLSWVVPVHLRLQKGTTIFNNGDPACLIFE